MAEPALELDTMPAGPTRQTPDVYLKKFSTDSGMEHAYSSIPLTEVNRVLDIVTQHYTRGDENIQLYSARAYLKYVYMRAVHAMCNTCGRSSVVRALRRCSGCHITYYYNYKCQSVDTTHWCKSNTSECSGDRRYHALITTAAYRDIQIDDNILMATLKPST